MSYSQVIRQIKAGEIKPIYLLYGEERYLARKIEAEIIAAVLSNDERDMNLSVYDCDPSLQELKTIIETMPFFGDKKVVVIRDTALFKARKNTANADEEDVGGTDNKLLDLLADIPNYCHLIYIASEKADRRRKIYKSVEKCGVALELTTLRHSELREWLSERVAQMGKRFDREAFDYLTSLLSLMPQVSLEFLDNEMNKLDLYTTQSTVVKRSDIQDVFSSLPEVSVFAMLDAIALQDADKALSLLERQLAAGAYPLRLLALLGYEVRRLWQVKDMVSNGAGSQELVKYLKLPAFVCEKLIKNSSRFSEARLRGCYLAIAEADANFKIGRADNMLLERIVIELCS